VLDETMTSNKSRTVSDDLVIVIDTREQMPLDLSTYQQERKCLKTGDYSIVGGEHLLCIERKSLQDLYGSIFTSRFKRELERMQHFLTSILVIEATLSQVSSGSSYSKANPKAVVGALIALTIDTKIKVVFANDRRHASNFVGRICEKFHKRLMKMDERLKEMEKRLEVIEQKLDDLATSINRYTTYVAKEAGVHYQEPVFSESTNNNE
jgi:ERCC4-type nuclease